MYGHSASHNLRHSPVKFSVNSVVFRRDISTVLLSDKNRLKTDVEYIFTAYALFGRTLSVYFDGNSPSTVRRADVHILIHKLIPQ